MHWFLDSLEYTQIYVNNNVFRNDTLFITIYVDDIYFEMTDCKMCKHYLEMLITQNRTL